MTEAAPSPRKTRLFSWIALLLLPAGPLLARIGIVPGRFAFLLSALGVLIALVTLVVAIVMLLRPKLRAQRGAIARNAAVAAIPVAIGMAMIAPGLGSPLIHDVSTDLADPPQFAAALARRGAQSNPIERTPAIDAMQQDGFPGLGPIASPLEPAAALARVAQTARALGWEVYSQDPATGTLEASETTRFFGFVDDIVVRVRADGAGSRIDLRSVSRVGKGDLGANHRRIERFRAAFTADSASN